MNIKPQFGSSNNLGQWWDGKTWRKWAEKDDKKESAMECLRLIQTLKEHDENNCHVDGCFKCPRCRRMHFVPVNYDLLCDGCSDLLMAHNEVSDEVRENIVLWRKKARNYFAGNPDADITERFKLRETLTGIA